MIAGRYQPFHTAEEKEKAAASERAAAKCEAPADFTLFMAITDAIPVLLFCAAAVILCLLFPRPLFIAGAALCVAAGSGKVLWKLIIALKKVNVMLLNRQLRILMPVGFGLMLIALLAGRSEINISAVLVAITTLPAGAFFALGAAGCAAMLVLAKSLDGNDARSNWIEQAVNIITQASLLVGLCFLM